MTAMMAPPIGSIMLRLRESTAELHESVEKHPFQVSIMAGSLPRQAFACFLGQMWLVHHSLEAELRQHGKSVPAIDAVVRNYQFKVDHLAADLEFYGVTPDSILPTPATQELVATIMRISGETPAALLGMHYVLEGSTNGGKFVAKRVSAAFGLAGPDGLRYLDPYGDAQRGYWQQFKSDMDAQEFTTKQQDMLVVAAKTMFAGIGAICEDLWRSRAA